MNFESQATPQRPVPVVFDAPAGSCFGWFHPAQGVSRSTGVVLCRPMGYEALCSHRTYTLLAESLAEAGWPVLRFDYHGTGDSAGADIDAGRVAAWTTSIEAAIGQLKRIAGVSRIALFGVRLGATLAVEAAVQLGGVDSLILWSPCVSGRAFIRELRAANATRTMGSSDAAAHELDAMGCLYTAPTLEDLQTLDCAAVQKAPARRALIIARDDMPSEGPLPARYRKLGMDVTFANWPGYAAMMGEPLDAKLEPATLQAIAGWLSSTEPRGETAKAPAHLPPWPEEHALDGVRESAQRFGANESLFGILCEPPERRGEVAVLMLNVGGNHHIGPHRMYVRAARALAAAGHCSLRFDLAGVGDSRMAPGSPVDGAYFRQSMPDVREAIDLLAQKGCRRFYLMGICSGAYVAFQTALLDARVNGQILMNPRFLEWEATPRDSWQASMRRHYKSIGYYRRALLQSHVYQRLLRGEVDVKGVAHRVATLLSARVSRAAAALLGRGGGGKDAVLNGMRRLGARGCDTLMIMSEQDDALDYVEFHLGHRASSLRADPNFRMVTMEHSDHTFSTHASQRVVIEIVRDHLERRRQSAVQWNALGGSVAAT